MKKLTLLFCFILIFKSNFLIPQNIDVPQANVCRNGLFFNVPAITPVADTIRIPQISGCTIIDVNVKIDSFYHTWDADMEFRLIHNSENCLIINHVGGSGDNFIHTFLDDSASVPISSGIAPFTGSFIPSAPLSIFNGTATTGNWLLRMYDPAGADLGYLKAWCLQVTYQCPTGGIQTAGLPNAYKLEQNYPNPFNPLTSISFELPQAANIKLTVFDINGKTVKVIVNEFRNQGTYSETFDASNNPSGVYFYKLEAVGSSGKMFSDSKKMVLIK